MILEAALITTLITQCAPNVAPETMQALIATESSNNPWAIGVTNSPLIDQPTSKDEAVLTAKSLIEQGANISVGLAQINHKNWPALGLNVETAFEYCPNIKAADEILSACFIRAEKEGYKNQDALKAAFSCYYSNNFKTGMIKEKDYGNTSYVERIAKANERLVPAINFGSNETHQTETKKEPIEKVKAIETLTKEGDNWDVFKEF